MPYIGNDIQFGELTSQTFTGDGSTVAFTMGYSVANTTSILVTSGNVVQEPTVAYTVSGTTLTFTSAPEDGDTIHVRFLGRVVDVANAAILQDSDQDTKIQVEESADEDTIRFDVAGAEVATLAGTDLTLSSGNVVFGTAGKGVYLGVTSATAANLLDDYEEGLHVATLTAFGSGGWVMNSAQDTLSYTKIGRLVHVQGLLTAASDNSASGQLVISLPFTQLATAETGSHSKPHVVISDHGDGGIENAHVAMSPGVSDAYGANITDGGATEVIDHSRLDAAFTININMCYYAA